MKIALVISSLEVGGAESQLCQIAKQLKNDGHEMEVWLLRKRGDFLASVEGVGIPVLNLGKRSRIDVLRPSINLIRYTKAFSPDAIFCILPSACLHALAAKFAYPKAVFCWRIVATKSTLPNYGRWAGLGYELQRLLAGLCDHYISNSRAGALSAVGDGFNREKMHVLQNGVDTNFFKPDPELGKAWLSQIGLDPHRPVIGIVGRLDLAKDHETFFKALTCLEAQMPGVAQYVILGRGSGVHADLVKSRIEAFHRQGIAIRHIEHESDMSRVYNALTIFTMTSVSEGLPNALLEALACGTYCVVTDVGDCAEVMASDGVVANIKDSGVISIAWRARLLSGEYESAKQVRRVQKRYGLQAMVRSLADILAQKEPSRAFLL